MFTATKVQGFACNRVANTPETAFICIAGCELSDARPAMITASPDFTISRLATDMKTMAAVYNSQPAMQINAVFTRAADEIVVEIFGIGEILS